MLSKVKFQSVKPSSLKLIGAFIWYVKKAYLSIPILPKFQVIKLLSKSTEELIKLISPLISGLAGVQPALTFSWIVKFEISAHPLLWTIKNDSKTLWLAINLGVSLITSGIPWMLLLKVNCCLTKDFLCGKL